MVALQRERDSPTPSPPANSGPDADSDEAVYLVSILITGVLSQAMANEPDLAWGKGRFSPLFPKLIGLLPAAYPPAAPATRRRARPDALGTTT